MRKRTMRGLVLGLLVCLPVFAVSVTSSVWAESSNSSHYQITEMQFGSGSSTDSCSDQYCAHVSIGDDSAANSETSAAFGQAKYSEPTIEMIIEPGESSLGDLSTERTGTKTTLVKVRNYESGGYLLQLVGTAPTYKNYTLKTPQTPAESKIGTEQFGINVVANTIPTVGAAIVQVPADKGVFGQAMPNYATPNLFMYKNGDVIARSLADSGGADYTISMVVNISTSTPAGHYTSDFSTILVPAY